MALEISNEHAIETFKSMIQISVEGMKLLGLLNGGAAVALLPYLASRAGKEATATRLGVAMLCYLAGLALCGLTYVASYFTQLRLYGETMQWVPRDTHIFWLNLAIAFGSSSLVAFIVGSILAAWYFLTLPPAP
jgi:hypothetical protein